MNIPANLKERIDEVIGYVGDTTADYLVVKRQLINNFPSASRNLFSARHTCTKKHQLNEFDQAVILYWYSQTGIHLEIDPNKLHDPDWKHKKKGWALSLLNEERKRQHAKQQPKHRHL
jgi:hypothetical protein